MLFCISGSKIQSQGSVAGDVAGKFRSFLQGEDGKHQGSAGVIKEQDAGNESLRMP